MINEHPSADYFDFTWSEYGLPRITRTAIYLPVTNFWIAKGYNDSSTSKFYHKCLVIFLNVSHSVRRIHEYESADRRSIKSAYEIIDGPFDSQSKNKYIFYLDGISYVINAWVDWEIIAESVEIDESMEIVGDME